MKSDLATARLNLLPVNSSHRDFILGLFRHEEIKKFLFDEANVGEEFVDSLIQNSDHLFSEKKIGLWLMTTSLGGDIVGLCGFFKNPELEILYVVHPSYQKRGFAVEASKKVLSWLEEADVNEDAYARIDIDNRESRIVADKIGMKAIGEEVNPITGGKMAVYKYTAYGFSIDRNSASHVKQ
ncbi:MAG: GNAT family N-acetyltransferase [Ignavibacteriales bacterium]|nr:GNAT family N-acetyltransferase [Ignavibacteriales bacterium]